MGSNVSRLQAAAPQAPAGHTSPPRPRAGAEFSEQGLVLRSTLGTLHRVTEGFEDASEFLARVPQAFRPNMRRLELQVGSDAHAAVLDAFAQFGSGEDGAGLTESTLRDMMLAGKHPDRLHALGVLLRYGLVDFSKKTEPVAPPSRLAALNPFSNPACSLIHRMAIAGVEQQGQPGLSALHARFGLLAASGVCLNLTASNGETPLMWAAKAHALDAARALVGAGADVLFAGSGGSSAGYTALHLAARAGDADMVGFLIAAGTPPDVAGLNRKRRTPLHLAAAAGNCDVIRILRRCGANMNARASDDASALLLAVRKEQPQAIRTLIQSGAAVNLAHGPENFSALHCAARVGAVAEVVALLESGANPNLRARGGLQPLHLTGLRAGGPPVPRVDAAAALLAHGAEIDSPADNGLRPVDVAGNDGSEFVFNFLVAQGAAPPHRLHTASLNP